MVRFRFPGVGVASSADWLVSSDGISISATVEKCAKN